MDINSAHVTVSADEARNGLIKAMLYLEAQAEVEDNYVAVLRTILEYVDSLASAEYYLTHKQEINDNEQHTNIVCADDSDMMYHSDYDKCSVLAMRDVDTVFEEEVARENIEIDESIELTLSKHEDIAVELITCDATGSSRYTCDTRDRHKTALSDEQFNNVKVEPCTQIIIDRQHYAEESFPSSGNNKQCHICELVCRRPSALTIHMRTHTSDQPLCCGICHAEFQTYDAFNSHVGTHKTVAAADIDLEPSDRCIPDTDMAPNNMYNSDDDEGISIAARPRNPGVDEAPNASCDSDNYRTTNYVGNRTPNDVVDGVQDAFVDTTSNIPGGGAANALYNRATDGAGKPDVDCTSSTEHDTGSDIDVKDEPCESQKHKNDLGCSTSLGSKKKCHICGVVLRRPSALKLHLQLHSVERPFECGKCLYRFWNRRTLNIHMGIHSNDTTSQCTTGRDRFTSLKTRTSSKSIHVANNKCLVCGMICRRPSELKRHLFTHTNERPFTCDICNAKFKTRASLSGHSHTHDVVKPFECSTCGQRFVRRSYLKLHAAKHNGEGAFKCMVCDKVFITPTQLKMHMNVHSDKKPHLCNTCGVRFKQKRSLVNHMIKTHEIPDGSEVDIKNQPNKHDGTLFDANSILCQCKLCGKYLKNVKVLKRHMKLHSKPRSFPCSKCDKSFKWKSHLSSHEKIHIGVKPHVCKDCGKHFSRLTGLRFHSLMHKKEFIRPSFLCNTCGKFLSSNGSLKTHLNTHKEKPHYCDKCNRYFKSVMGLFNHMRMHSGDKGHQCFTCKKYFTTMGDLKKHFIAHHNTDMFTCHICEATFLKASYLNVHMNIHLPQNSVDKKQDTSLPAENKKPSSIEQKEKPFSCDECGKAFTYARTLKTHKKLHTGNIPYRCNVCNKGCNSPSELQLHMTVHTGVKSYLCDLCDKRFRSAADKKRHMRTHNDSKPYACRTCGQCFGRPDALKKHAKSHEDYV